jgi:hypothetical protein
MRGDSKTLWAKIIRCLRSKPCEIQTVRLNESPGVWLSVEMEGQVICIDNARLNRPSARLSQKRYISEAEFVQFAPYYDGWRNGQYQRSAIRNLGKNTSYIFALVHHFDQ